MRRGQAGSKQFAGQTAVVEHLSRRNHANISFPYTYTCLVSRQTQHTKYTYQSTSRHRYTYILVEGRMTSTTRRSEQGRQQCSSFLSVRRLNIEFVFNCGVSVLISFDLAMPNLPDHCYQCNSNACSGQLIGPYWYYYRVA